MFVRPADRPSGEAEAGEVGVLRQPKAILRRALLGGVSAGGLLGALVVLPDSVQAQFFPEPDTVYPVTWSALLVAVPIGALVGIVPALLALVVWEWQVPRGSRRARIAGSATAALTVVTIAGVFQLLSAVGFVLIAALVSFAIAYLSVPTITTKRRQRRMG